ncbi:hypothetical protein RB594_001678 [Gaeumannomyces avenae]
MQEVLNSQLKDVKKGLGSDWDHVGVGRDDGKTKGEYSPILYKKTDLRLLDSTTKWLSPTPDEVSFGWGAGSRRVTTIAVLEHAATGRKLLHANCHLDNVSAQARSEGIKVVVAQIKAMLAKWGPLPVSLSGDFNSSPYDDAFKTLADTGFMKGELFDLAQPDKVVGPYTGTYTTFSPDGRGAARIDFLWLGPGTGTTTRCRSTRSWTTWSTGSIPATTGLLWAMLRSTSFVTFALYTHFPVGSSYLL